VSTPLLQLVSLSPIETFCKRNWALILFIKKMGSWQIGVKAFLDAAISNNMMLDQWIPNKDWVYQIGENGKTNSSIVNLNTGLALQYVWQNNHATPQGRAVFYDEK
jgi:hypothetical protein